MILLKKIYSEEVEMVGSKIYSELEEITLKLEQILLNPNSPRFISENWKQVDKSDYSKAEIQKDTRERLIKDYHIEKLVRSMKTNGYMPIDRIVVSEMEGDKYVVLEGNRRICAGKELLSRLINDSSFDSITIKETFERIPCLLYSGDDSDAAWRFQGARHIDGIQEWSAFSKLNYRLMDLAQKD